MTWRRDARAQRAGRSTASSGRHGAVAAGGREVSIESRLARRAPASSVGDACASTCSAASSRRGSPAFATSTGTMRDRAGSCSCSAPACSSGRRTPISPSCARRRTRRRGPGCSATWSAAYANVSVIDVREVVQTVQGVLRNVTLAISVVGGIALFCGAADPDRGGGDDEVPAPAGSGAAQDARGQQPHRRGACWSSSTASSGCWPASLARSAPSGLSYVFAAASSTCPGRPSPGDHHRRRRRDGGAGGGRRCRWPAGTCCGASRSRCCGPREVGQSASRE